MKSLKPALSLTVALGSLLTISNALAEPAASGSVGRYRDGRAYRVDSQGLQLSDQIAELEMTIREQEEQLIACEEKGTPAVKSKQVAPEITASNCAPFTSPLQETISRLNAERTPLQNEILSLKSQLSTRTKAIELSAREKEADLLESQAKAEQLAAKLTSVETEKESSRQTLAMREQALSAEIKNLKEALKQKDLELAAQKTREANLSAAIDQAKINIARNERAVEKITFEAANPARGMLASETDSSSEVDLSTEKRKIQTELASIQKLIVKRKDLSDSLRASKKGVAASLQSLETSKGVSLDKLRSQTQSLTSTLQAEQVNAGLKEIKKLLEGDIQVFERLIKHL